MPKAFIALFSLITYITLALLLFKKKHLFDFSKWPPNQTLFMIWVMWLVFIGVLAPLSYYEGDMRVWVSATRNLLEGKLLPAYYVYLPIYAELLASLAWPFHSVGIDSDLFLVYIIHLPMVFSYAYCAKLMSEMIPEKSPLAPLGIVLAPVTVFFIFFGTNHIVMLFCLLASLALLKSKKWFWSGFFALLGCYKFLLIPTIFVLLIIIIRTYKWKGAIPFVLGGLVSLLPSFAYYCHDLQALLRIISHRAAIGSHAGHIEPFHFLFFSSRLMDGFEAWYLGNQVWLYLSLLGMLLSIILFLLKRLNTLQSLAFSCAAVAIFSLEPFRIEPMIGLLWLDAIFRRDLLSQGAIFSILFVHAATFYDLANSRFLVFAPQAPLFLWEIRGFYLGVAIVCSLVVILFAKNKQDLVIEGQSER